jgi:hypothetical protein
MAYLENGQASGWLDADVRSKEERFVSSGLGDDVVGVVAPRVPNPHVRRWTLCARVCALHRRRRTFADARILCRGFLFRVSRVRNQTWLIYLNDLSRAFAICKSTRATDRPEWIEKASTGGCIIVACGWRRIHYPELAHLFEI